jgi:hypothetical protein
VQPSNSRVTSPAGSPFQTSLEKMGLFEHDEEVSTTMATGVGGGRCGKNCCNNPSRGITVRVTRVSNMVCDNGERW